MPSVKSANARQWVAASTMNKRARPLRNVEECVSGSIDDWLFLRLKVSHGDKTLIQSVNTHFSMTYVAAAITFQHVDPQLISCSLLH